MKFKVHLFLFVLLCFSSCKNKSDNQAVTAPPAKQERAVKSEANLKWAKLNKELGLSPKKLSALMDIDAKYKSEEIKLKKLKQWKGKANRQTREALVKRRQKEVVNLIGRKKFKKLMTMDVF